MSKSKPTTLSVEVRALRAALKGATDVVEARNTVPILSNVRLTAQHGKMELQGTDLDIHVKRVLDVEQAADAPPFDTTVAAGVLAGIVAKLDAEARVTLELADGKVRAACGRARFTLPTLPVDDFPPVPTAPDAIRFEIAPFALNALLDATRFAISTDEVRYYLGGVYLHASERLRDAAEGGVVLTLRGAATDGHRLARFDVDLPDGAAGLAGVIIPSKALKLIDKLADGAETPIDVAIGERSATFDFGDIVVTTKLIDGSFPDYTRVIPSTTAASATLDRTALTSAVERVILMSSEKTHVAKFVLAPDVLTISVQSAERGSATEEVPCDYDGSPITIGFNGRYVLDVAGHVAGDSITIELNGPNDPTIWRDANAEARALYVLMPARV